MGMSTDFTPTRLPCRALDPLTAPIDETMRELCYTAQLACYVLRPDLEADSSLPALEHGLFVQDWQEQ